jgi:ABC-type branched-subunit amino acid transport system substrate-binding protein
MVEEIRVTALAGYVGTPTTKPALPIVEESKTPLVGIFSGAGVFRGPVQRYVINVRASYDEEVEQIVKYMTGKLGNKRIAVLYQNDSFGASGLAATEKALRARSLEVAAKGSFERNTTAVKAGLASILAGNPDAMILVGPYKPVAEFVRQAHSASLKATFAAISFVGTESLLGELGSAGDGLIISEVVPSPVDASLPVAKAYREALAKSEARKRMPASKATSRDGYWLRVWRRPAAIRKS